MQIILKKENITVLAALNGKECVAQCHAHPEISLVLMDIRMPVMDGLEATREIKSFRKDLPIIALTAWVLNREEQSAFDAGCDDFLIKPVNSKQLFNKLQKYGFVYSNVSGGSDIHPYGDIE